MLLMEEQKCQNHEKNPTIESYAASKGHQSLVFIFLVVASM